MLNFWFDPLYDVKFLDGRTMPLKELLSFVWNVSFGIAFAVAVGFLIRPKLGEVFKKDFALGVWSLSMVTTTAMWMFSYLTATFWELHITDRVFDRTINPDFGFSHVLIPILLGFGFAVLVSHSWKLYIVLPAAVAIGFADLIGNSIILNGISEMLIAQARTGQNLSAEAQIFQEYFLENPHLLRVVCYLTILIVAIGFTVLSLGERLLVPQTRTEHPNLSAALERNRQRFDRFARSAFLLAVWGNETVIWSWRITRTADLRAIGKPWWF